MKKNNQSIAWTSLYRPSSLAQLHQVNVREQLQQFQEQGFFPQVLLFAGPKGTGKTTSARIIGAMLNSPQNAEAVTNTYLKHQSSKKALNDPDASDPLVEKILRGTSYTVHELDAASNRGINEIRELKDRSQLAPVEGVISVFILDEVHMLTTPAFNALLKLLEEPPGHTTFILATTEIHKIPETVISRCQVVSFHQASKDELEAALSEVAGAESLTIDKPIIARLAELAQGSFRDGVKYLQKIATFPKPDLELVDSLIAPSFHQRIDQLIAALLEKDGAQICALFQTLRNEVADEKLFITQLLEYIHQDLLHHYVPQAAEKPQRSVTINLFLLKEFTQISQNNALPFLSLEICCLSMIERSGGRQSPKHPAPAMEGKSTQSTPKRETQPATYGEAQKLMDNWSQFISKVEQENITLASLFRSAQPKRCKHHVLELEVYYQFHKEQLNNSKHYSAIKPTIHLIAGGDIEFEVVVVTAPVVAELVDQVPTSLPEQVAAALMQSSPTPPTDVVQSN